MNNVILVADSGIIRTYLHYIGSPGRLSKGKPLWESVFLKVSIVAGGLQHLVATPDMSRMFYLSQVIPRFGRRPRPS